MNILKLRKRLYRNNGSVLFIVLVVMSIMIILATTTMYVVNNQHASIEVHYASEQSYQSAKSISAAVGKLLTKQFEDIGARGEGVSLDAYKNTLAYKILNGTSVASDEIDLSSLGFDGSNAKVEITNQIAGPQPAVADTVRTYYQIKVTATVNNETSTFTELRYYDLGPVEYFTRFLTCTGNRPDDVRIGAGEIYGDAVFENDYTELVSSAPSKLNRSLYAYGNLKDVGIQYVPPANGDYTEAVIRGNYIVSNQAGSEVKIPYIFVGGDFDNGLSVGGQDGKQITDTKAIYVCGDFSSNKAGGDDPKYFIKGDCDVNNHGLKGTYYVAGDLNFNMSNASGDATFYVQGNTNGTHASGITVIPDPGGAQFDAALDGSNDTVGIHTWTDVENHINEKTTKQTYKTWNAEKYFDQVLRSGAEEVRLDDKKDLYGNPIIYETNKNVILKPFTSTRSLVLDATEHDVYVYLDDEGSGTFTLGSQGSNIFTKGDYSVIVVLPDGTDFVMSDQSFMGNKDLLKSVVGTTNDADVIKAFAQGSLQNSTSIASAGNLIKNTGTAVPAVGTTLSDGQFRVYQTVSDDGAITECTDYFIDRSLAPNANNNLFLVTTGKQNSIDLGKSTIFGYIYGPDTNFKMNNGSAGCAIVGGMITGTYTYANPSAGLVFAKPHDYTNVYGGADIVTHLMQEANSVGGTTEDSINFKGAGTVGYK